MRARRFRSRRLFRGAPGRGGKRLLYLLAEHHELFLPEVIAAGRDELARDLLTRFCHAEALRALDLGAAMVDSMERRSRVLCGIRDEPGRRGPEQLR